MLQACSRAGHTGSFLGTPKEFQVAFGDTYNHGTANLPSLDYGVHSFFVPCPFQSLVIRGFALNFLPTSQLAFLPPGVFLSVPRAQG